MAEAVVAEAVVVVAVEEEELVREPAAVEEEEESVREPAVAVGMVTAVSPRGTMLAPAAAWQSVLVVGRRSPRPVASIAPTPQPNTSRPRPLEGPIREVE